MLSEADELVPDPQVWRELGISPMTGWRWSHDQALCFPPAVKIRNRNYRSRRALNAWIKRRIGGGASTGKEVAQAA